MSDARLRALERRWRETGAVADEARWHLARLRAGDLDPRDAGVECALERPRDHPHDAGAQWPELRKLDEAAQALAREDPLVRARRDGAREALVLAAPSEGLLRGALERLSPRAPAFVATPTRVAYRQALQGACEVERRVVRQTSCRGQFAVVALDVSADAAGEPIAFEQRSDLSPLWVGVVEAELQRLAWDGAGTGVPFDGLRVVLRRGREHEVDSTELSFVQATRSAWADALERLERVLLEPRLAFRARGPAADQRRAAVALAGLEAEVDATGDAVVGDLPLARAPAAAATLRDQLGGRVRLELAGVCRFGPVPAWRAAEVLEARRRERAQDDHVT